MYYLEVIYTVPSTKFKQIPNNVVFWKRNKFSFKVSEAGLEPTRLDLQYIGDLLTELPSHNVGSLPNVNIFAIGALQPFNPYMPCSQGSRLETGTGPWKQRSGDYSDRDQLFIHELIK